MKTISAEAKTGLNILKEHECATGAPTFYEMLHFWRQKVGYFSMFAVLPTIVGSEAQSIRAADALPAIKPLTDGKVRSRPLSARTWADRPAFLKRQNEYRLPHQRGTFDLARAFAGSDDCPGVAIPGGNYTAAAPYTDSGNTTGANNTINQIHPYYVYDSRGPDHVYSFTITGLGFNPQIEVSTTSGTYKPMVHVLRSDFAPCPAGTGNFGGNAVALNDSRWSSTGSTARLEGYDLDFRIPRNVPLHVFVDSQIDDSAGSGPYTLRMQDVTIAPAVPAPKATSDFDGDGRSDLSVYRPSNGIWYLNRSTAGPAGFAWGTASDKIVPADYDRDGKTDIAVFRPSEGRWYIINSNNGTVSGMVGAMSSDIPAPIDFDGDQRINFAVFRPSEGRLYAFHAGGWSSVEAGQNGDIPVIGDYNGDGQTDIAFFRPSTGVWIIRDGIGSNVIAYQYGLSTDKVVPADYDGDRKTDIAVYRPSEGRWYIANSGGSPAHTAFQFGLSTDIPIPGDYDGDGRADIAIFRPSDGNWWLKCSTAGVIVLQWGQNGDKPTPSAYGN